MIFATTRTVPRKIAYSRLSPGTQRKDLFRLAGWQDTQLQLFPPFVARRRRNTTCQQHYNTIRRQRRRQRMSASLPSKRKRDDASSASGTLPPLEASSEEKDLTRDQVEQFFDTKQMNDRQRLSWALQTEARVRLSKLQGRTNEAHVPERVSHTLDSEYLFDVYENGPLTMKHTKTHYPLGVIERPIQLATQVSPVFPTEPRTR